MAQKDPNSPRFKKRRLKSGPTSSDKAYDKNLAKRDPNYEERKHIIGGRERAKPRYLKKRLKESYAISRNKKNNSSLGA